MPVYDFDGYDDYPTAQILREHVRKAGSPTITAGGRNGGNRLACPTGSGNNDYVCRAFPAALGTVVWGCYMSVSLLVTRVWLFDLRDADGGQVGICLNTDGSLAAARPSTIANTHGTDFGEANGSFLPTYLGTSAPGLVAVNVPFHLQVRVVISDTVGAVQVRLNNILVLDIANADTRNGAATVTNLLMGGYGGGVGSGYVYFDDFWVASTFLGDRRVDSHLPVADGANTGFTPSSGVDHFAMVDEASPDDDTTKVTATPAGTRETYKVESFKNPGATIDAVKTVITCKKVEANTAQLATCIRSGGANHDGVAQGIVTDWKNIGEVAEADPGTAAAWAESAFGAAGSAEFGQHKAA